MLRLWGYNRIYSNQPKDRRVNSHTKSWWIARRSFRIWPYNPRETNPDSSRDTKSLRPRTPLLAASEPVSVRFLLDRQPGMISGESDGNICGIVQQESSDITKKWHPELLVKPVVLMVGVLVVVFAERCWKYEARIDLAHSVVCMKGGDHSTNSRLSTSGIETGVPSGNQTWQRKPPMLVQRFSQYNLHLVQGFGSDGSD
jgi:hypothetical protein